MNELLGNPAIQGGVIPFVAALIVSALLYREPFQALAIATAFAAVVVLAVGFSFDSLTSVRKLVLIGFAACALALALEFVRIAPLTIRIGLAGAAAAASLWVVWRLLQQQETGTALLYGFGVAAFVAAMVDSGNAVADDPLRAASAGLVLGLGGGLLALLGGSALLALVGIAIGAGSGAVLLVQMISGSRAVIGRWLGLPAIAISSLVAILAVLSGQTRWFWLIPLLAVPWMARLVPPGTRKLWLTAVLTSAVAVVPVLLALALAWFSPVAASN